MRSAWITIVFVSNACANDLIPGATYTGDIEEVVRSAVGEEVVDSLAADFNFDGKPEKVVQCLCGNAGCENYIFEASTPGEFKFVGNAYFHKSAFFVVPDRERPYGSITAYHRVNATDGCVVRYRYSNRGFEKSKDEICGEHAFDEFTNVAAASRSGS